MYPVGMGLLALVVIVAALVLGHLNSGDPGDPT